MSAAVVKVALLSMLMLAIVHASANCEAGEGCTVVDDVNLLQIKANVSRDLVSGDSEVSEDDGVIPEWQIKEVAAAINAGMSMLGDPSPEEKQAVEKQLKDEFMKEWEANNNYTQEHGAPAGGPQTREEKENQGEVKSLYTVGSPGSGSPGLKSIRGACFSGLRVFSKEKGSYYGFYYDPVPWFPNADWLWHPKMDAASVALDSSLDEEHGCESSGTTHFPPWGGVSNIKLALHETDTTYNPALKASQLPIIKHWTTSSQALGDISYEQHDLNHAQDLAQSIGKNVVGAAKFEGSWSEGFQVSYLLQDPNTMECVLTFQGTYSTQDLWTDLAARAVSFCGLTQRGENCCTYTPTCVGDCAPKGPNDSFVHMGFRNQLRRMTGHDSFKNHIHANLPSCASVSLFGHSLGGAMAELFTACAERGLEPGDYGFEDYDLTGWEKGTPKALPTKLSFS